MSWDGRAPWSTDDKVWGIMPKAAWCWSSDNSIANDPFGAPDGTPSCVCLPPPGACGWWLFNCLVLVGLVWTARNVHKVRKVIKISPLMQSSQMTALFMGGVIWQQEQPHTSFVSVWLQLNSDFVAQVNIFVEPSNCNEIPLRKMLCSLRGTAVLAR
jgi:hypothetical protein